MTSFEKQTHVFIVRVWCEPREIEDAGPEWRGVIEHVRDGKRHYLRNLDEIPPFIMPYLEEAGVKFSMRWRVGRWLRRWRL